MHTRKQYLNDECTHREYYAQYVNDNLISHVEYAIGKDILLASTDDLNDIPLSAWNNVFFSGIPLKISSIMRENGDFPTQAGSVCIVKEAAQQFIEQQGAQHAL